MNETTSIAGDAARNFAILALSGVCSVGTTIAASRALAPAVVGTVALASAVATLGAGILVLGLPSAITRFAAEATPGSTRTSAIARHAVVNWCGATTTVAVAFVLAIGAEWSLTGTIVGDLFVVLGTSMGAFSGVFGAFVSGLRRFDRLLKVALWSQPTTLALAIALAITHPTAVSMIGVQVFGLTAAAAGTWLAGRDQFRDSSPADRARARADVHRVRFHLASLAVTDLVLWQRSEVIVLGVVSNRTDVAFYALAYGLVSQAVARLPGSLSGVLLPAMASDSDVGRANTYRASTSLMALLLLPIVVLAATAASDASELLFGSSYRPVGDVVRILVFGAAASALCAPAGTVLLVKDRQRTLFRLGAACAALDLALAFPLATRFGGPGAAAAAATAQLSAVPIVFTIARRATGVRWPRATLRVGRVGLLAILACAVEAYLLTGPLVTAAATVATTALACLFLLMHSGCDHDSCVRCSIAPLARSSESPTLVALANALTKPQRLLTEMLSSARTRARMRAGRSDLTTWANALSYRDDWNPRNVAIANAIPADADVIEFGCGLGALRRHLDHVASYVGADLVPHDPSVRFCDLNARPLPSWPDIAPSTAVFSGVLEYVLVPSEVISWLPRTVKMCIASYMIAEGAVRSGRVRRASGWVNDFTLEELVAMFESAGFRLLDSVTYTLSSTQPIMRFQRRE